jgi:hypothetical protein
MKRIGTFPSFSVCVWNYLYTSMTDNTITVKEASLFSKKTPLLTTRARQGFLLGAEPV